MLSAAVAAGFVGPTADVAHQARQLLLSHQGQLGLFPHALPSESLGRLRSHVGCFADQVYPIQALARRRCRRRPTPSARTPRTDARPRICAAPGPGRSVVVALRRPRRLRRRGLPGLQRAPARDGARWRSSTCSRPAATTTARAIARGVRLARHASRGASRSWSTERFGSDLAQGRTPRAAQGGSRTLSAATTAVRPGPRRAGARPGLPAAVDRPRVPTLRARLAALRLAAAPPSSTRGRRAAACRDVTHRATRQVLFGLRFDALTLEQAVAPL